VAFFFVFFLAAFFLVAFFFVAFFFPPRFATLSPPCGRKLQALVNRKGSKRIMEMQFLLVKK
jgi:hypothetical protein